MWRCRPNGPRRPPTSWSANISMARWGRPTASAASGNWCIAWWTPSPTGALTGATSKPAKTRENFRNELAHLMLTQKACFNSPVWFNVGVSRAARLRLSITTKPRDGIVKLKKGESHPQCSACFINSVKDSLESILDLAKTEGMLFKWGSGTGTNLSPLREEGGGLVRAAARASGPLSFMKGFDAFAGVIKSGGKTRRAAKMVILNVGSSRHRSVRLVQGERREEGAHADRRGLRCRDRWRRVRLHLLPERQQFGARDRRVHGSGSVGWRLVDALGGQRPAREALQARRN